MTPPPIYGVYGAGGCGRGILPLGRDRLRDAGIPPERLVFIDDRAGEDTRINGHRVITYRRFLNEAASDRFAALAVASGTARAALADRLTADGVHAWGIRASNVVTMDDCHIAEGELLSPFVTLTSNIRIGRYFHANLYSYVEHDCIVGDFVTFAPGAKSNGNIVIEDFAYIGSNAVIKQGRSGDPLVIGRGAVVGMGAVVTKSVAPGVTVVGNPARPLQKSQ